MRRAVQFQDCVGVVGLLLNSTLVICVLYGPLFFQYCLTGNKLSVSARLCLAQAPHSLPCCKVCLHMLASPVVKLVELQQAQSFNCFAPACHMPCFLCLFCLLLVLFLSSCILRTPLNKLRLWLVRHA